MSTEARDGAIAECPFCESQISATAKKCRHCGEWVARDCLVCGTPIRNEWAARGKCAPCQSRVSVYAETPLVQPARYDRTTAGLLGVFLGGVGGQKFYLGKPGQGILSILFCWTMIPALIGMIEGISYLASSDDDFRAKHG